MSKSKKRKTVRKKRKSDFGTAMIFAAPFTIGFLAFILYPFVMSFYYSLTEFNALKAPVFTGLENYRTMLSDPLFWKSMKNTLYMVFFGVPLICGCGLLAASLLNHKMPLQGLFRTLIYLPSVIPPVAVALVWAWILNPTSGLLNAVLEKLGVGQIGWLSDARYSKIALLMIGVWSMGNVMVMYLATLQDVPGELYESAEIDGAGAVKKFLSVTIPAIKPVMVYNFITTTVRFFCFFDLPYALNTAMSSTANVVVGSPLDSTMFFGTYIYVNGFKYFKMGYASALSWVLMLITLIFMVIVLKWGGMLGDETG